MTDGRRVIVGLGNHFRGDDRAGLEVAEGVRERLPEGTEVLVIEGDATPLLDVLESSELVLVVDAVAGVGSPGTVHRFDASENPIPGAVYGSSTHAFGLGETIELARALGQLRARVLVYGITAEDFSPGHHLSPAVEGGIRTAIEQMLVDLSLPGRRAASTMEGATSNA